MMFSVVRSSVFLAFSLASLVSQAAAAGLRPRGDPIAPSSRHTLLANALVDRAADLEARAGTCPVGWAFCSAFTCFPLDGSVCCDDGSGTFCPPRNVCIPNGCCPIGETCQGSGGTITIGGGQAPPPPTDTFVPPPITTTTFTTSTRRTPTPTPTTTSTRTTPTTSTTRTSASPTLDTEDPLGAGTSLPTGLTATPDASAAPTSFFATGTGQPLSLPTTTTDRPQFPDGGSGAAPAARGVSAGVLLSVALAAVVVVGV
ncbi:hypothetical protein C8Q77DRAFT_1158190 [Trametes polyzona]|nr:hypothetical protein C8Q77DRAFT_1158190 [Trametes polyzona]